MPSDPVVAVLALRLGKSDVLEAAKAAMLERRFAPDEVEAGVALLTFPA